MREDRTLHYGAGLREFGEVGSRREEEGLEGGAVVLRVLSREGSTIEVPRIRREPPEGDHVLALVRDL